MELNLKDSVSKVKGVGPKKKELLSHLHIETVEDLLGFFPRKYEDRSQVTSIMEAPFDRDVLICGKVVSRKSSASAYNRKVPLRILVEDNTGSVELVFFNAKYLQNYFLVGQEYVLFGKITLNYGRRQMAHPEFHKLGDKDDVRGILPVYPLTEGITQNQMRSWQMAVKDAAEQVEEWLPNHVVMDNHLCSPAYAIRNIHFPTDTQKVKESRYRMVFEELLVLQTGLFYIKKGRSSQAEGVSIPKTVSVEPFLKQLPFDLTPGQKKVWDEIEQDLAAHKPMNRLVQGDVGSGKTAVAELAMYKAVKGGYQAVMMAPTELLAKQHLASLRRDLEPLGLHVELLSSGTRGKERTRILDELERGKIDVLVGTHAIIQPDVRFRKLGIVITDEQHRFGVNQRALLTEKGQNPNVLVMTATPIPRTLAVILFGDLDISVIDTMPTGRKPIRTYLRYNDARKKVYDFLASQVAEGRQCYVVAPLIEESENLDCRSAEELYEEISKGYPKLRVGLVHGGMKQDEKDAVMEKFAAGAIDILVSTVVIEVGIDVANATVMVIENCERFGLAQLHQLRGRVGRSDKQSHCILICGKETEVAAKRNELMVNSTDGFTIAEEDLKLRGPGEIFGTRQHGLPELNIADLVKHVDILDQVKDVAKDILEEDPYLRDPDNQVLRDKVKKMFGENIQLQL
ncbi:MAG: ATP-dependent DNA helicase RecG [Firmicutes bacterium]|nr:ATP-dependent DNA helicase RecG [Bacillota bacterium]